MTNLSNALQPKTLSTKIETNLPYNESTSDKEDSEGDRSDDDSESEEEIKLKPSSLKFREVLTKYLCKD